MGFGGIGYGGAWLWMVADLLFVVGIVLLVVWAIGVAVGRPDEDEAIVLLRARFARGEIDAAAFERARQTAPSSTSPPVVIREHPGRRQASSPSGSAARTRRRS